MKEGKWICIHRKENENDKTHINEEYHLQQAKELDE